MRRITEGNSYFYGASYIYGGSVLRYLSAIALGMWVASEYDINSKRNYFIIAGSVISFVYLVASILYPKTYFNFTPEWGTQNLISFFYPAAMILLGIKYLPNFRTNVNHENVNKLEAII